MQLQRVHHTDTRKDGKALTDWPMFWVSLVAAAGTLAAVVVAVVSSVQANRRADQAEARQQTIDEDNIRRRDEDLRIERARITADLDYIASGPSSARHERCRQGRRSDTLAGE